MNETKHKRGCHKLTFSTVEDGIVHTERMTNEQCNKRAHSNEWDDKWTWWQMISKTDEQDNELSKWQMIKMTNEQDAKWTWWQMIKMITNDQDDEWTVWQMIKMINMITNRQIIKMTNEQNDKWLQTCRRLHPAKQSSLHSSDKQNIIIKSHLQMNDWNKMNKMHKIN